MSTSEPLHHHRLQLVQGQGDKSQDRRLSTGLPSPNLSSTSLSSSSSSLSPYHQHAPRTPRTPTRSVYQHHQRAHTASPASPTTPTAKARPSPLFRLLLPLSFSPASPPPQTATTSRPSSPTMTLHHPTPHYSSQPPSPTSSTGPQAKRPSSRSAKLLRDTLKKDEIERQSAIPLPQSPLASATLPTSPSGRSHRRRHSHVPTTSNSMATGEQEFTRGSFLFRTAMNTASPRSPSPSPSAGAGLRIYGGDAEGSAPTTPHRAQHHQQSFASQQQSRRGMSPASNSRSPARNVSPSPMRRRQDQNRPAPLPLDGAGLSRHHPVHHTPTQGYTRTASSTHQQRQESPSRRQRSRPPPIGSGLQSPAHLPPASGEPLLMTPHEQVLRARLEKVLTAGRVVEQNDMDRQRRRERGRSESGSRSNEVRDEEGGWPWREKDRETINQRPTASGSVTSSPLYSSASGSSSQLSHMHAPPHPLSVSQAPSTGSRTRSQTDPIPPVTPNHGAAPSPRRSTTAPNPSPAAARRTSVQHQRTGTTPPLVADMSPMLNPHVPEATADEDGELRLLTPPPTPPFTARMYSYGGAEGYCPSPYKTHYSANVASNPYATTRRAPGGPIQQKAGLLGAGGARRRPTNAPLGQYSSSDPEHEHEEDSSSCSSRSFPTSSVDSTHGDSPPFSPPATAALNHHLQRPQFNARKASAQCRAMEGYVSFASVEGLGEPPADPLSPTGGDDEDGEERGRKGPGGVLAWGVGGFRKLLNVVGGTEAQQTTTKEGVVL